MHQNDNPYLVTVPLEIIGLLRALERRQALVRMHVQDRPISVVTTILDVDVQDNKVILDHAAAEDLNQIFIRADFVRFETALDSVPIFFSSSSIEACTHDGLPALAIDIPASLSRLQRRESYRVSIPALEPALCTIVEGASANGTLSTGDGISVELRDISSSGLAIMDYGKIINYEPGTLYHNCLLDLPRVGSFPITIRVVRCINEVLPSQRNCRRIGAEFVDLPNAVLIMIQRYIGMVEREQSARRKGF